VSAPARALEELVIQAAIYAEDALAADAVGLDALLAASVHDARRRRVLVVMCEHSTALRARNEALTARLC